MQSESKCAQDGMFKLMTQLSERFSEMFIDIPVCIPSRILDTPL